ncbi:MAG: hypothetical protein ABWZ40_02525 [Caulobacterales bacterium]
MRQLSDLVAAFGDLTAHLFGAAVVNDPVLLLAVALGAISAVAALAFGFYAAWRGVRRVIRTVRARTLKEKKGAAILILIAGYGRTARIAKEALEQHFSAFTFDAPHQIEFFPLQLPSPSTSSHRESRRGLRLARRWRAEADADLIVWGNIGALRAKTDYLLLPAPGPGAEEAEPQRMREINASRPEDRALALAYMAARAVRPTLSRPYDFKPDRIRPSVSLLGGLINAQIEKTLDPGTRRAIAGDYAAAAASLGDRLGDPSWLETAIAAAEAALPTADRRAEPAAWARLKQTIARSNGALGELRRDVRLLQAAKKEFQEALDAVSPTPEMQAAQVAARGLQRCESSIEALSRPQAAQNPAPQRSPNEPGKLRSFYGSYAASMI